MDYTKKALETARMVMAEVNPTMPRTHGESFVPLSDIHCFVEVTESIAELKSGEVDGGRKKNWPVRG